MIQEYYLHMFFGVNGEYDQQTGSGRIAIATLMSGFGLLASTKKDLQNRVGWRVTPGCFLGQKELLPTDHYCRNYEETRFAVALAPFRKVNRTMNYQLDWGILNGDWDFRMTSPIWIVLAKIYWAGKFMFGRNVISDASLTILRDRFNSQCEANEDKRAVLRNPFIMQFMKDINLPIHRVVENHLFTQSSEDRTRTDIFASLLFSSNHSENVPGFYTAGALIPLVTQPGFNLRNVEDVLGVFASSRVGRSRSNYMPLNKHYYYSFGMGSPSLPNNPSRMPNEGRNIVPLLFCDTTRTPQQEAQSNYSQVRGTSFNQEYLVGNIQTWLTAAVLWEYHLLLTGQPLFPLEALAAARQEKAWTPEYIQEALIYLNPANTKNCSVAQIARFNLERQLQV